ncbi:hypothetical protein BO99DRAFT_190950 [Aspergillus violaceofuscus CBS 115571]|uniref:Uncharacterized protein n=1 Tax=Aspergillus violaceofuscus (strain CBS 115571) TaxID=1450538 RepID=A0A2V5H9C7_ASPV1|nr:hypothetical protein BO99DRAFT_190950 [Aspergillus violaceofuscus CBS 115571]
MVSGWEWPEDDPTFVGYSQFTEADPHGWQFSLDGQRLRMRSKVTGLDPRWLRLAAFQPLFRDYFEELFETVHLPRESYQRTPSPQYTPSEGEKKEYAEWEKLMENEEELAEWEKRMEEDQPAFDDAYDACDQMPATDWKKTGERAFEAEERAYQIRCQRAGRVMVGPDVLESRDGKVMDDFAQRLAEAWLLPESPFDAFNPKIKRLEPDVPTTWTLRDEFR